VIAGGCGKLGIQFARVLARAGAQVILIDARPLSSERLAVALGGPLSGEVKVVQCDVTNRDQIQKVFSEINQQFGRLDFFISNVMAKPAGYYASAENYSEKTWRDVIDSNLNGSFFCCQAAANIMSTSAGGGSIVLVGSIYGMVGPDQRIYEGCTPAGNIYDANEGLSAPPSYSASKGALAALAKHLATGWGSKSIRVNLLIPGGIHDNQESVFHEAYVSRVPLRRMAVWSDFNGAILFLVSDASRYMTGTQLVIDGGWTAW
jgi:NAD(P)-dependent dehydrogenase (short-subunit alcohol dehydrogenase family)